jgi:hypothetical protein
MNITTELLAAYAEGNVTSEERMAVRQYLTEHPQELSSVVMMMDEDYDLDLEEKKAQTDSSLNPNQLIGGRIDALLDELKADTDYDLNPILPLSAMAAENTIDNLCAIQCEGYALRKLGIRISDQALLTESKRRNWLTYSGVALHNIGRLCSAHGLYVSRYCNSSIQEIKKHLSDSNILIAVIDHTELKQDIATAKKLDKQAGYTPNHAIVIQKVDIENRTIQLYDSNTQELFDTYPLDAFLEAWNDSANYLIIVSDLRNYEPHPIDLKDVAIAGSLLELREAIAENAHEVWAYNRKKEGWTYGAVRDDARKQHPDMIPYDLLPETEKEYDREMAINTIKLVKKLGWDLVKR